MTTLPIDKLESLSARFREIEEMLCQPNIAGDPKRVRELSVERSELQDVVEAFGEYQALEAQIEGNKEALSDPELRELAEMELEEQREAKEQLESKLQLLLLPKDPNDGKDIFLEIRSGAGGDEASLFAADLFRMYQRFAERRGWKVEVTSKSETDTGGFREVIAIISGEQVYSQLKFEGGVHRVQRVPATESQGRIHTSTATVAIMPEADDVEVEIDEKDLKITKTAAGGPGGQGVNTTMSAINLLHIPTGIMVRSEEQRSQHQNLERAMQILRAKLFEQAQAEQHAAISAERRSMVGTGDRSEKIRTYNFPQSRVTDHRIQLTLHSLDKVIGGEIDDIVDALRAHERAELLEAQQRP